MAVLSELQAARERHSSFLSEGPSTAACRGDRRLQSGGGGGRARVHSSPLPSRALSPKDPAGGPFHHTPGSRQAREAPPEQPRLPGLTCTPLILTVASTFPSPSRVRPASLPSTSALGPPLGAGHSLSTLCGTPTWAPKHSVKLSELRDISVALMPSFRSPRACGNRASD